MENRHHFFDDRILVVEICGDDGALVPTEMEDFLQDVVDLKKGSEDKVAFNFSEKRYLSSSGLGDLIMAKDFLLDQEIELILIGLSDNISSLLNMVGVEDFFTIISTEEQLT